MEDQIGQHRDIVELDKEYYGLVGRGKILPGVNLDRYVESKQGTVSFSVKEGDIWDRAKERYEIKGGF